MRSPVERLYVLNNCCDLCAKEVQQTAKSNPDRVNESSAWQASYHGMYRILQVFRRSPNSNKQTSRGRPDPQADEMAQLKDEPWFYDYDEELIGDDEFSKLGKLSMINASARF